MSERSELIEQIVRDEQTLRLELDEENRLFYIERITDYREELLKNMTPQEELFAELFNHEKILVKDMDMLVLRAHREELSKIAFEARARLTAVDDEERTRKPKKSDKGFERSVNTDEQTTDAINTIKDRQKRLTKLEKIQAGLEKLGISSTDAAKLMTSGAVLGRIKSQSSVEVVSKQDSVEVSEDKPIFNPFEKK